MNRHCGTGRVVRLNKSVCLLISFLLIFILLPHDVLAQTYHFNFQIGPLVEPAQAPPTPLRVTTVVVNPDQDAEINSLAGKIILRVPKGAVDSPVQINLSEFAPLASTGIKMIKRFDLDATVISSGAVVTQFNKDLQLSLLHAPGELEGMNINSLRLYYFDDKTKRWLPMTGQYDQQTNTLNASFSHFTHFGEQVDPLVNGPGRVMAAQVDPHSGAAIYGYPLELPPGPGGFQPKLELTYNSGAVNEMKNKRSTSSWVGMGWTLHLGRISYDSFNKQYFLELNGASYELVSLDDQNYKTNPDMNFKIYRGSAWEMWDREGNYYRFGWNDDARQRAGIYYRWDLSSFRDTNLNEATVSYQQDWSPQGTNLVRSAYPSYLRYGNVEVHFTVGYDENDQTDGYIRYDNPKSYTSYPAPVVMETRRLDSIEVKVSNTLIRKYTFSYSTTNRVYSTDYAGIYYSGSLKLNSVTQVGADGTTSLPALSFSYQEYQIYRHTSEEEYNGNPGNAASLSWPYLTQLSSGYGGSVTFAYSQIPTNTTNDIWTREIVTSKTVDSGIQPTQSTTYTYTGNPKYFGTGWDQKYRGFSEVKETDGANNYVKHFYYTAGKVDSKDGDRLTGKEYKTQWFNNSDVKLKETLYDWTWNSVSTN